MRMDKSRDFSEKTMIRADAEKRSLSRLDTEQRAQAHMLQSRASSASKRADPSSASSPKPASSDDVDVFEAMLQKGPVRSSKVSARKPRSRVDDAREEDTAGAGQLHAKDDTLSPAATASPLAGTVQPSPFSPDSASPIESSALTGAISSNVVQGAELPITLASLQHQTDFGPILADPQRQQDGIWPARLTEMGQIAADRMQPAHTHGPTDAGGQMAALLLPLTQQAGLADQHGQGAQSGLAGGQGASSTGMLHSTVADVPDSFDLTLDSAVLGEVQLRAIRIPAGWRVQLRMSEFEKSQWLRERHGFVQRGLSRSLGTDVELEILD